MTLLDVLAIGSHPDDIELACGGTLALLADQGYRTGMLHLTRGEAGTRGSAAQRRAEAEAAATALGAAELDFLDCGDGDLRTGTAEQDALIEVLRRWRPEIVLGPTPADRHPDHSRAHTLVREACFYAGLRQRRPETGEPHRPGAVFSYMQHHPFDPSFIVDVTATWQRKRDAIACYDSQFFARGSAEDGQAGDKNEGESGEARDEPETKVSSREFAAAIEGRARHFGQMIGAEFGEPFWSPLPLAVANVVSLLPEGHR